MTLPSFVTPQFQEFFRLGLVFENHSSYCSWRSGSSFCGLWLSGAEEDADQLQLTDKLLQAVLAELRLFVLVSLCLLLVILMLILLLSLSF